MQSKKVSSVFQMGVKETREAIACTIWAIQCKYSWTESLAVPRFFTTLFVFISAGLLVSFKHSMSVRKRRHMGTMFDLCSKILREWERLMFALSYLQDQIVAVLNNQVTSPENLLKMQLLLVFAVGKLTFIHYLYYPK